MDVVTVLPEACQKRRKGGPRNLRMGRLREPGLPSPGNTEPVSSGVTANAYRSSFSRNQFGIIMIGPSSDLPMPVSFIGISGPILDDARCS
jgi:hypothetical protein